MLKTILKKKMPFYLGLLLLLTSFFLASASLVLADQGTDTGWDSNTGGSNATAWGDQNEAIQERTGLGNDDPRLIIANLINIALGFLGIIAVLIIIYAGFLWMTSQGNPDKIQRARKTLLGGIIGLVIILSAFALAAFVMDVIFRATTDNFGDGDMNSLTGSGITQPTGGGGTGYRMGPLGCSLSEEECVMDPSGCDELGPFWSCNPTTCLCQVQNLGSCYNSREDVCNIPCSSGLSCFGETGCVNNSDDDPCGQGNSTCACCCDPANDQCGMIYPSLECKEDTGLCTGGERGMCCGCEADNQCVEAGGSITSTGCGNDTCCHNRPRVVSVIPADGADRICTNALVSMQFTEPMNSASFYDNMYVIGEFVGQTCPEGTTLFSLDSNDVNITAQPGTNYCRVSGSYRVRNTLDGHFVDFIASQIYETTTSYNIYLKSGVINADGSNMEGGIKSFYSISMADDYHSTFTTIEDVDGNDGICVIDQVNLTPTSYLFKNGQSSVREVDDNAEDASFDSERDNDKLLEVEALSPNRQVLASMPGYQWDWVYENTNDFVVRFVDNASILNMDDAMRLIRVVPGVTDGRSEVRVTVDMDPYVNSTDEGNGMYDRSRISVFICNNPWPPEDGNNWQPWSPDQLSPAPSIDYNYEIYYCRDLGHKGTADDLPAFDNAGIASSPEPEVLQQIYFTYQTPPPPGSILSTVAVSDSTYPEGGAIELTWTGVPDVSGYKVYWSERSGQYRQSFDVGHTNSYIVGGLENGERYYFSVTAYTADEAESSYFEEVSEVPEDTTPPTVSPTFGDPATFTISARELTLNWTGVEGVDAYQVSYGLSEGMYGAFVDVGLDEEVNIKNLSPETTYYFSIQSLDEAGNLSLNPDTTTITTLAE